MFLYSYNGFFAHREEAAHPMKRKAILASIGILFLVLANACASSTSGGDASQYRFEDPVPEYLYTPDEYSSDQAWPLFIAVHGSAGNGLDCWTVWQRHAESNGFVLLCPELADADGKLHQLRGNERLGQIINRIYREYSLQSRIYLVGFSGGGQFVQGYAFSSPAYLSGVAVIAPGSIYTPPSYISQVPFLIVTGLRDHPQTVEDSRTLASLLETNGNSVSLHLLEGIGHAITQEVIELTLNHYRAVVP
jgi:dienelactone hydrolase